MTYHFPVETGHHSVRLHFAEIDACTLGGVCLDGQCASGGPISCPLPGQCRISNCDAQLGCFVTNGSDGVSCDAALTGYASQPSISTGLPGLLQPLGLR